MFSTQEPNVQQLDDRGAVLVEYAMLFALVVIVAIAALSAFGLSVLNLYTDNTDSYTGAVQRSLSA